jgi:threonine dehydrogenase-like Zn-dependent dehydrogenase
VFSQAGVRVVFPERGECEVEEFSIAAVPDDALLVRNDVSLISPGTELAILLGRHRAFSSPVASPWTTFPYYPGYNAVGRVEAVGGDVAGFEVGDRVYHASPHASISVCRADGCIKVPDHIPSRDAVFFGLVEIAMTAPRRAPIELGDSVIVSGLGLVGMLVASLYQTAGAFVTVADYSRGRLLRGEQVGFDEILDLNEASLEERYSVPDAGPDVSIEAAGSEENITACMKITRPGGRVVLLGSPRKVMEVDPYTDIHRKGLTIIGAHVMTVPPEVRRRDTPYVFSLCKRGLPLDELRSDEVPCSAAPDLYARLDGERDDHLAVLLTY